MEGDGALLEVRSSRSAACWSGRAGRPELRPEKGREGEREGGGFRGGFGAGLRARALVIPEHAQLG